MKPQNLQCLHCTSGHFQLWPDQTTIKCACGFLKPLILADGISVQHFGMVHITCNN